MIGRYSLVMVCPLAVKIVYPWRLRWWRYVRDIDCERG